jgi:enoyl-CoA hydratase
VTEVVRYEVADRVAVVTLDRPEARNALSAEVRRRLWAFAEQAEGDDAVDVVILTGADPAFCAGLDLKELGSGATTGGGDGAAGSEIVDLTEAARPLPPRTKPLIGAVNGVAVTGGLELALACDFLVASERARFADTHSRVGIQPGWGLTVALPAAVGVRRAKEMSATGNFVDAATALSWGLVNHVVAHGELMAVTRRLALDIVSNDQAGVRRLLQTYDEGALGTRAEAAALETRVSREWLATGQGGSPAAVEARRLGIVERGRSQVD